MSRIYSDNAQSIGNTPLVQINRLGPKGVTILAKIEGRNPGYSVKCRIGANMIWDAESRGVLKPGMTLVEPTSGNTGIGLAFVAAARGYKLILTMPASMSLERRKVLKALGAELVLTEPAKGMKGAIAEAEALVAANPTTHFMPAQFDNPANPAIHEKTTGPEIWEDTDGQVDVFISGVGTGGTLTGVSRYIKGTKGKKDLITVAVEPTDSPVITQALAGEELKPGPHKIQGIGAGFIPGNLDLKLIDTYVPLIIPTIAAPTVVFFMKQYMESTLSLEMIEAARIDGCGEIGIFLKVVLPSQKPAIGALGIYMFMSMWNNFMWPLIILSTKSMYNFPVALAMLDGVAWRKDYGVVMLATVCAVLPIMIIFLIFQKQFVAGVMGGAVKE